MEKHTSGEKEFIPSPTRKIGYFVPVSMRGTVRSESGVLYAEATLLSQSKSLVSYDIPITNEKGELVAKFYGRGFVRQPR